jgi:membrane-associated phospholipid phosphatase
MVVAFLVSMWPGVFATASLVLLAVRRGVKELLPLLGFPLCGAFVEGLKHLIQQPRPVGSCLVSCGMPSGHAAMSLLVFTWLLAYELGPVRGRARWPVRSAESAAKAAFAVVLLLTPLARVVLYDHTTAQVLAGSGLGCALGLSVWWLLSGSAPQALVRSCACFGLVDNYSRTKEVDDHEPLHSA